MAVRTWAQLRAAFANNNTGNITAVDMRDLIDTLEEQQSRRIATRVQANGSVDPQVGQKTVNGSRPETGLYLLTAPTGYVWRAGVAIGNNLSDHRDANVSGAGSATLSVSVRNGSGERLNVSFDLVGELAPA